MLFPEGMLEVGNCPVGDGCGGKRRWIQESRAGSCEAAGGAMGGWCCLAGAAGCRAVDDALLGAWIMESRCRGCLAGGACVEVITDGGVSEMTEQFPQRSLAEGFRNSS